MPIIAKIPHEVEQVFGPAATDKFVDFLNATFLLQKEDVVTMMSDRFEKTLTQQIATVRMEVADLRTEMRTDVAELRTEIADLRAEVRTEIAEVRSEISGLRAETKADIASVHKEISGVHKEITGLHREISIQTRWMLVAAIAIITLYPIVSRLVARLIPLGP